MSTLYNLVSLPPRHNPGSDVSLYRGLSGLTVVLLLPFVMGKYRRDYGTIPRPVRTPYEDAEQAYYRGLQDLGYRLARLVQRLVTLQPSNKQRRRFDCAKSYKVMLLANMHSVPIVLCQE